MAINRKPRNRPERTNPVLTLIDAVLPLVVAVNAKDIKGAERSNEMECAAAHALCRQEHAIKAMVCKCRTYVWHKDNTVTRYITPKALRTELMVFDRGGTMAAGDYMLMPPKGSMRLGHHIKPKGRGDKTAKVKKPQHIIENVRADGPKGLHLARLLEAVR